MNKLIISFLSLITTLSFNNYLHSEIRYQITEIVYEDPQTSVMPQDINDNGVIVGDLESELHQFQGFIWNQTEGIQKISPPVGNFTSLMAINNAEQVLGETNEGAFLWDRTNGFYLFDPNLDPSAMNHLGQVVGMAHEPEDFSTCEATCETDEVEENDEESKDFVFMWEKENGVKQLNIPGFPMDINDRGQVLVCLYPKDYSKMIMPWAIWENGNMGKMTTASDEELANDLTFLMAVKMNQSGDVLGFQAYYNQKTDQGSVNGKVWENDEAHSTWGIFGQLQRGNEIIPANALVTDINDNKHVIGYLQTSTISPANDDDADMQGFIFTKEEGLKNLNDCIDPDSGWQLGAAMAINNAGQIVGMGEKNGKPAAYLLTPIENKATQSSFEKLE